jgi:predicted  nucleic acid-binding Zn ribbon protein
MTSVPVATIDRRSPDRTSTPACPSCGTDRFVVAAFRSKRIIFFRCDTCRHQELIPTLVSPLPLDHGLTARLIA